MNATANIRHQDSWLIRLVAVRDNVIHVPLTELASSTGSRPQDLHLECLGKSCTKKGGFFVLSDELLPSASYDLDLYVIESEEEEQSSELSEEASDLESVSSASSSQSNWEGLMRFRYKYEDPQQQERYQYLVAKKFPLHLAKSERKTWKKNLKKFYVLGENGKLYRKSNEDVLSFSRSIQARLHPLKEVVRSKKHAMRLMLERHERAHDGRDRLLTTFNNEFFFKGIKAIIEYVCGECLTCKMFSGKQPKMTQAITTTRPMEIVMFDLTRLKFRDEEGFEYLFVMKDHFTKYHWVRALKNKTPEPIVSYLLQVFREHGAPSRFHSDNGGEFVAKCVNEAIKEMGSTYTHGKPRHPQTQGLVEKSNHTIKSKLLKVIHDDLDFRSFGDVIEWIPIMQRIVDNENNTPVKMYNMTPFFCKNGRERDGQSRELSPIDKQRVWEHMKKCQEAAAGKRFQFPVFHEFEVGTIVLVRANKTEIKDEQAIGPYSARAVIHQESPKQEHYFILRWLSQGISQGKKYSRDPGAICGRPIGRNQLTPTTGPEKTATVYEASDGHVMITDTYSGKECNYVYLSGEFQGEVYRDTIAAVKSQKSMTYKDFVEWEQSQEEDKDLDQHVAALEAIKEKPRRIPKKSERNPKQERPKAIMKEKEDVKSSEYFGSILSGVLSDEYSDDDIRFEEEKKSQPPPKSESSDEEADTSFMNVIVPRSTQKQKPNQLTRPLPSRTIPRKVKPV